MRNFGERTQQAEQDRDTARDLLTEARASLDADNPFVPGTLSERARAQVDLAAAYTQLALSEEPAL